MKIKCKKCGKRFELEMYSGLCPKCGTYNGAHMAETDISQYLSSGFSGEEAHRNLHNAYDRGYEAAHPNDQQQGALRKGKRSWLRPVLVLLIVLIPVITLFSYQLWERKVMKEVLAGDIRHVGLMDGNSLLFADGSFEAPVRVTALSAEYVEPAELEKEDKMLIAVGAKAFSTEYSFDAKVNNIALEYECNGIVSYQSPIDRYYLEEYLPLLGLTEDDILSTYGVGNGRSEEGYWFFCVPKNAEAFQLSVMACKGSGNRIVFSEGTIPLEHVSEFETREEEAAQ